MDLETLRGIAELMEEHGLTRLKLDEKDLKLDIAREVPAPASPSSWRSTASPASSWTRRT